jgi:hypothetical protein
MRKTRNLGYFSGLNQDDEGVNEVGEVIKGLRNTRVAHAKR